MNINNILKLNIKLTEYTNNKTFIQINLTQPNN